MDWGAECGCAERFSCLVTHFYFRFCTFGKSLLCRTAVTETEQSETGWDGMGWNVTTVVIRLLAKKNDCKFQFLFCLIRKELKKKIVEEGEEEEDGKE